MADVAIEDADPRLQPQESSALADHPARARLSSVVAAVLEELQPPAGVFTLTVAPPSPDQIEQARVIIEQRPGLLQELTSRVGVAGDPPAAWGAQWTVGMRTGGLVNSWSPLIPATGLPSLLVQVADFLQDCLVHHRVTDPYPPCPGHQHALQPVVLDDAAWWQCPRGRAIRPFANIERGELNNE